MTLLEVQLEARNLLQLQPLFLHSKTTGAAEQSEVVEIAILNTAGMPLADELVKPKRHIRQTATEIHGIIDEMVESAPKWSEILPKIEELIIGRKVCLYDPTSEIIALRNPLEPAAVILTAVVQVCTVEHVPHGDPGDRRGEDRARRRWRGRGRR